MGYQPNEYLTEAHEILRHSGFHAPRIGVDPTDADEIVLQSTVSTPQDPGPNSGTIVLEVRDRLDHLEIRASCSWELDYSDGCDKYGHHTNWTLDLRHITKTLLQTMTLPSTQESKAIQDTIFKFYTTLNELVLGGDESGPAHYLTRLKDLKCDEHFALVLHEAAQILDKTRDQT